MDAIDSRRQPFRSIVGGARGFDTLVEEALRKRGLPFLRFDANWDDHGHVAGDVRNLIMLEWLQRLDPNGIVIAGWDGKSPGTRNCIAEAEAMGISVWPIMYVPSLNGG